MKTSQSKLILAHLRRGKSLTKPQSFEMFGCWNTGNIIYLLRKQGHDVQTTMIASENRNGDPIQYAMYWLA